MWTDEQIKMFVYDAKDEAEIERTMISMRNHIEAELARRAVLANRLRTLIDTMRITIALLESEHGQS